MYAMMISEPQAMLCLLNGRALCTTYGVWALAASSSNRLPLKKSTLPDTAPDTADSCSLQAIGMRQSTGGVGAKLLAGGTREGAVMEATLLEGVPRDCDVMQNEVFGPVLILERYAVFRDAVSR